MGSWCACVYTHVLEWGGEGKDAFPVQTISVASVAVCSALWFIIYQQCVLRVYWVTFIFLGILFIRIDLKVTSFRSSVGSTSTSHQPQTHIVCFSH